MNWNLEGLYIKANYLGEFPVIGKVRQSRVAYGGRVRHHIDLDTPINLFGADRDTVIIEHEEVLSVHSSVSTN